MDQANETNDARRPWVAPEIQELAVGETAALVGRGADAGGNPLPDSQRS